MLIFEYHPDGVAIADTRVESYLLELYRLPHDPEQVFRFSTSNLCDAARALYKEKRIPYLTFRYQGKDLVPNPDGRLQQWPTGFCDVTENWLCRLLD